MEYKLNTVSLFVVPGSGQSNISLEPNTTVREMVENHGLSGRSISIDSVQIPMNKWDEVIVNGASEVFATKSVKGAAI